MKNTRPTSPQNLS